MATSGEFLVAAVSSGFAVLDAGPVEQGSLALAGSRLYWTKDGEPRTALLR